MQALAAIVGLVAIGYGFASAGIVGALTGLVAAVGTGSGLAIAFAEGGTGVADAGFVRNAQRTGGVLAALSCIVAAYFGGWRSGWAWGIGGYAGGVISALVLWGVYRAIDYTGRFAKVAESNLRSLVPATFDLDSKADVAAIEDIRRQYAAVLMDDTHPYARCVYRPSSMLPYPKPVIRAAVTALLDFVEGRRESVLLDRRMRTMEVADNLKATLVYLDQFLDVTVDQLPMNPLENASIGSQL